MESLKRRLRRAEKKAGPLSEVLRLEDGTEITFRPQEKTEAFFAALAQQDHWLLPYFREVPDSPMGSLIWALETEPKEEEKPTSYRGLQ